MSNNNISFTADGGHEYEFTGIVPLGSFHFAAENLVDEAAGDRIIPGSAPEPVVVQGVWFRGCKAPENIQEATGN